MLSYTGTHTLQLRDETIQTLYSFVQPSGQGNKYSSVAGVWYLCGHGGGHPGYAILEREATAEEAADCEATKLS